MGSTGKGNAAGKGSTWEERVEGYGGVRWRRNLERACSTGFLEGKCGHCRKCGRKRKYGNVEQDTSKATMVDGDIRRGAKAHKG